MITRRLIARRGPLPRTLRPSAAPRLAPSLLQRRHASQEEIAENPELHDPNMNGGYLNPPPHKRSQRDPYGDWWDSQDRRNWGEPVHEDHDILGVFAPEEYRHFRPPMAFFLSGCVIAGVLTFAWAVRFVAPDKIAAPRTFGPDGLEAELGGPGAVRALKDGESWDDIEKLGHVAADAAKEAAKAS